jgi:spore maturation protein CgeB
VIKGAAKLLIAGNLGGTNIGDSFHDAARRIGISTRIVENRIAFEAPTIVRHLTWRLLGRRPPALRRFNVRLRDAIEEFCPDILLATGVAPVTEGSLRLARSRGIVSINYLTDDPWNPTHRSRWFLASLPEYDAIFTPRTANLDDLRALGCRRVDYLPFGYDPRFAHPVESPAESPIDGGEIVFVGGADLARVKILAKLIDATFRVVIYGSYWDRFSATRTATRGHADPETLCRATASAKVALCLVKRENRDGHVMRTYEIGAIGACMIAEDTAEHRQILGDSVVYFSGEDDLVTKTRKLLDDPPRRRTLAAKLHERITRGGNTYEDRLRHMLKGVGAVG